MPNSTQTAASKVPITRAPITPTQYAFRALSDPTRREILVRLAKQDLTISEVSEKFPITRGAVKKHLRILEEGHLISVHPRGRERINRLEADALKPVSEWINYFNQFWDEKLSGLQSAIQEFQNVNEENSKGNNDDEHHD